MDYPEMHIGPEPTTDRFIAVVHGNDVKTIQGNAVTGVNDLPFSGLSTFGSSFLNKFNAAVVPALLLENITIIDTPGVLSGDVQFHYHHTIITIITTIIIMIINIIIIIITLS